MKTQYQQKNKFSNQQIIKNEVTNIEATQDELECKMENQKPQTF